MGPAPLGEHDNVVAWSCCGDQGASLRCHLPARIPSLELQHEGAVERACESALAPTPLPVRAFNDRCSLWASHDGPALHRDRWWRRTSFRPHSSDQKL